MPRPPLFACLVFGSAMAGAVVLAWHQQWTAALLAAGAPGVGMAAVVLLDMLLSPMMAVQQSLAQRPGSRGGAWTLRLLASLTGRALLLAYTAGMIIGMLRVPGPPRWVALGTGLALASAPFVWISGAIDNGSPRMQRATGVAGIVLVALMLWWGAGGPAASASSVLLLAVVAAMLLGWNARSAAATRLADLMYRQVL
ncbi:hypothetical protein [Pseudoxanthomonas koreensis]|uniref:hypothetical protein n=1 Tax=Pseudoxanthomonas koreensis TaxID=266061 RepID=UPI0035A5BECB